LRKPSKSIFFRFVWISDICASSWFLIITTFTCILKADIGASAFGNGVIRSLFFKVLEHSGLCELGDAKVETVHFILSSDKRPINTNSVHPYIVLFILFIDGYVIPIQFSLWYNEFTPCVWIFWDGCSVSVSEAINL